MKGKSSPAPVPIERRDETPLLAELFDRPERLRERLVLAIALAPPKGRTWPSPLRAAKRRR